MGEGREVAEGLGGAVHPSHRHHRVAPVQVQVWAQEQVQHLAQCTSRSPARLWRRMKRRVKRRRERTGTSTTTSMAMVPSESEDSGVPPISAGRWRHGRFAVLEMDFQVLTFRGRPFHGSLLKETT